jgi:hypothetical protein
VAGPGKVHVQPVFDAEVTAVTEELCGLSSRLRRGRHLLMTIRINRSSRCGSRDLRGVRLVVSDDHSRLKAIAKVSLERSGQRCLRASLRNALDYLPADRRHVGTAA